MRNVRRMKKPPLPTGYPRIFYRASTAIAGFVAVLYGLYLLLSFGGSSSASQIAPFAVMISLTSVTFSFARAVDDAALRDRITFVGERFLHGAALILVSTFLLLLTHAFHELFKIKDGAPIASIIHYCVDIPAMLLYFGGAVFFIKAFDNLSNILMERIGRYPDWD